MFIDTRSVKATPLREARPRLSGQCDEVLAVEKKTHYFVLGIARTETPSGIRAAYRDHFHLRLHVFVET
jgi:hypothetical protein